jgi:asparagine synthase (glutamine-hydrolysing)
VNAAPLRTEDEVCGFVGVINSFVEDAEQGVRLDDALAAILHRGPDGTGCLDIPGLGLRHARLSIIDLTNAAAQPMKSACGRFAIVFNGEIYNYKELYREHLARDTGVNPNSDTSVLLSLFRRFGSRCVPLLDGMFAFAICDLKTHRVFLARDRFGEKPLFWLARGRTLAFASELKALRIAVPDGSVGGIDHQACAIYHIVGSIPAPKTIYRGVVALEPGHWMDFDNGKVTTGRYWSLPAPCEQQSLAPNEALSITRDALLDAVRSRMVSDVPVGLFLSGGIDSTAILSLLSTLGHDSLTAICIDFSETKYSEFEVAKRTAEHFGANIHREVVDQQRFLDLLPGFFSVMDQPSKDGFNTYTVSLAARKLGIKVWLSGVGGDEAFAGYPSFFTLGKLSRISRLLMHCPGILIEQGSSLLRNRTKLCRILQLGDVGVPEQRAYQALRNPLAWRTVRSLLSPIWESNWRFPGTLDALYPVSNPRADEVQIASALESQVYMPSELLRDIDNFSMASSLELRAPYLSHKLFETVYLLDQSLKRQPNRRKPLLTEVLPKPLPTEVLGQPKWGFTFPMEVWLRAFMTQSFQDVAFDSRMQEIWDLRRVRALWQLYLEGRTHWASVWQLYAFARWYLQTCAR